MELTITTPATAVAQSPQDLSTTSSFRLPFVDNLRWVMIMLVLSMHAAVTYSGNGGWYHKEHAVLGRPELLAFVTYQAFLQSFFMTRTRWPGGTGPLWFCAALLIFCTVYAGYRKWIHGKAVRPKAFPGNTLIGGWVLLIAAATFLVRIPWPNGTSFYNMQLNVVTFQ